MRPTKQSRSDRRGDQVHSALGAGLLESTYDACSATSSRSGLQFDTRSDCRSYTTGSTSAAYRVDFIVEECRSSKSRRRETATRPRRAAAVVSETESLTLGLLINFNVPHLRQGIRRVSTAPSRPEPCPSCPLCHLRVLRVDALVYVPCIHEIDPQPAHVPELLVPRREPRVAVERAHLGQLARRAPGRRARPRRRDRCARRRSARG